MKKILLRYPYLSMIILPVLASAAIYDICHHIAGIIGMCNAGELCSSVSGLAGIVVYVLVCYRILLKS